MPSAWKRRFIPDQAACLPPPRRGHHAGCRISVAWRGWNERKFRQALSGFSPGSRVAGYLLEEQIGHGGMAVVFRALDERLNRHVALKLLAPAIAADEAFRRRFIRESQAAAAVDDPHIIPVYEAGEVANVL